MIRATSLSGVANHYVSISPGPEQQPGARRRRRNRPRLDHDADRHRPVLQHLPALGPQGAQQLHQGQRGDLRRPGRSRQRRLQVLRPGPQPHRRLRQGTERRPAPARTASSSAPASSRPRSPAAAKQLSSAISNANTAFSAIASQNVALDQTLRRLPPVMRQANTTFVNLRAALDDLDPLVNTAKPATKNLAPFLAELRPVLSEIHPLHPQPAPHRRPARQGQRRRRTAGRAADGAGTGLEGVPALRRGDRRLPARTSTSPAPTRRTSSTRLGKLGAAAGYYDGNGHYVRAATSAQNLFNYERRHPRTDHARRSSSTPSAPRPPVHRRCPGGATQTAADGSNPFVDPPCERQQRQLLRMQPGRRAPRTMTRRLIIAAALVVAVVVGRPARLRRRRQQQRLPGPRRSSTTAPSWSHGEQVRVAGANVGTIESVDVSMPGRDRSPTATASRSRSPARRSS